MGKLDYIFLNGVIETAQQVTHTTHRTITLFSNDSDILEKHNCSKNILNIYRYLQTKPVVNSTELIQALNISLPTVLRAMKTLQQVGIVQEITGKNRHKVFVYAAYLHILNEDTEPL